jgi:predicted  nucleic acid-binding Zn-ribbon protein
MNELCKLTASVGELRKRAGLLEAQLLELDERLAKVEQEDERRRSFMDATDKALAVACFHKAPEWRQ